MGEIIYADSCDVESDLAHTRFCALWHGGRRILPTGYTLVSPVQGAEIVYIIDPIILP
jgi:hypothetical protein